MLGFSISRNMSGQVLGPLAGGFVGGHIGMRAVFLGTSVLMAAGALANFAIERAVRREGHGERGMFLTHQAALRVADLLDLDDRLGLAVDPEGDLVALLQALGQRRRRRLVGHLHCVHEARDVAVIDGEHAGGRYRRR